MKQQSHMSYSESGLFKDFVGSVVNVRHGKAMKHKLPFVCAADLEPSNSVHESIERFGVSFIV